MAGGGDRRRELQPSPRGAPLHHGARRVSGRVRAALPAVGAREGAGVRAHPPALGVRVPLLTAAVAHLRHLLLRARLGGVQAQQRAAPARAARAGHPEAGAGMEGAGQQDLHVHRPPRLAHCLAAGWEVQEDAQKHHDQPDGHPGGGHQETDCPCGALGDHGPGDCPAELHWLDFARAARAR